MDPKQTPPQVGVNSDNMGASATGQSVFANAPNRFKDTTPKGDIIIPPSTPEKPKGPVNKKLIIGIVAAIIVAVVAVVLVITMTGSKSGGGSKSNGSSSSSAASEDVTTAFNKYANFIISGEASEDRIPSEDENAVVISKIIDHDADFMGQAKTYFDEFYDGIMDSEDAGAELLDWVANYKQLLDFLDEYTSFSPKTNKELSDLATKDGVAKAEAEIDNLYASFFDLKSADATDYANSMISYHKALLNNQVNEAINFQQEASDILYNAYNKLVDRCYTIDTLLFEGEESEAEEPEAEEPEEETEEES